MSIHQGKKSNSFTHKQTFLSARAVMNRKFIANLVGRVRGWNRHNDECLVKISNQKSQGVRRSKSQAESEQNRFSENKTSWLFFPLSSFCNLFMDVPPYQGANNIRKYLCEFFQRNTDPEKKLQKVGRNFTSFARGYPWFAQNFWKILPKWFFPEIPRNNLHWIWDKTRQISGQTDEYSPRKKSKQFHTQTNLSSSPGSDE